VKSSVKSFLARFRKEAVRRPNRTVVKAMGTMRYFRAYDLGEDTFVFQRGVWLGLDQHASVLMVEKKDLVRGARGHIMTVTTGNHSVAALPLLGGKFWDLSRVSPAKRGEVMQRDVLCANVVDGKLEISQRDVPCRKLVALDAWLTGTLGFSLTDVVMIERNDVTLDYYRSLGQEWRVRPLAWTEVEMKTALAASRKRIATALRYYHSVKGVHFLSYTAFHAFAALARTDFSAFREQLREFVSVQEGHSTSFCRQPKIHGHHEIEFFGPKRGVAISRIVPELEKLMEDIVLGRADAAAAAERVDKVDQLYLSLLTRPEFADEQSRAFVEGLYICLTGEIYSVSGDGSSPAFDDRRTALPGCSYDQGRPVFHPGCDARSEVLLSNLRALMSKDEFVEYANVYELRGDDDSGTMSIGSASTREIVYKTNRSPLARSLVEKRLSRGNRDYGSYVLARVGAFKALGVELADYRLLRRRTRSSAARDCYYIRTRCEGYPLADVPSSYFQYSGEFGGAEAGEDPQFVRALAVKMGEAAAQNMVMKKHDPATQSPLFGVGKEIYRFDYDLKAGRLMPTGVSCCSVRGSFGWPDRAFTEANLVALGDFYTGFYARALADFASKHPVLDLRAHAEAFFEGFDHRTRALEWAFTVQRDEFEAFDPKLPPRYEFVSNWRFVLWTLERQVRRIESVRKLFFAKLGLAVIRPAVKDEEPDAPDFELTNITFDGDPA